MKPYQPRRPGVVKHGFAPKGPPCAYCGVVTQAIPQPFPWQKTVDHIVPRARRCWAMGGVTNTRIACHACNQVRAVAFHCPAAVMAVRAVAHHQPLHVLMAIAGLWRAHAAAHGVRGDWGR